MKDISIQPIADDVGAEQDLGMLNPKQRLFCELLLATKDFNAPEAAKRAGYASPAAQATKLLANERIQRVIGRALHKRVEETKIDAARVLKELALIAFFDPIEMFDEEGNLKRVKEMPEHVRRAISSMKLAKEQRRKKGATEEDDEEIETTTADIRIADKLEALSMLAKHVGILKDSGISVNFGQQIDWAGMFKRAEEVDPIEAKIASVPKQIGTVEAETIPSVTNPIPSSNGDNGNGKH